MPESPPDPTPPTPVPWWLWPQILSLYAPAVSVAWMAVLARGHHLHLPPAFYWGLALVTWLIYMLDRTADAVSGRLLPPLSQRHQFCLRHSKVLLFLVLPLAATLIVWIALHEIPVALVGQGIFLCLGGVIYLASYSAGKRSLLHLLLLLIAVVVGLVLIEAWHAPFPIRVITTVALLMIIVSTLRDRSHGGLRHIVPKEVIAALLFALGCSAGVHMWTPSEHGLLCKETLLMWALFTLNMATIVRAEHLIGLPSDPNAESALHSRWRTASPVLCVLLLALCAAWYLTATNSGLRNTSLLVALCTALLGLLQLLGRRLKMELFHVLADVALLVPLPLFWLLE